MREPSLDATEDAGEQGDRSAASDASFGAPARLPARIGRFAILRQLGAGAMGQVLLGFDEELDRKIAIKLIHPTRAGDPDSRKRLLREARALAKLSHPNVVAVFDAGEHEGTLFIAMEYVAGTTLSQWLHSEPRTAEAIVQMFVAISRGLQAAHDVGLVHRDFKPDNVLVDEHGRPKVADFGLAGVDADAASSRTPELGLSGLTRTGALVGTPLYMSPQQFAGAVLDARTDQFSFFVALWQALYGVHPFGSESPHALFAAVCAGRIREPPVGVELAAWLRRVLERGLRVNPEERFASMDDAAAALLEDPTRRRRRRWASAAAMLAIAGVIAGTWGWATLRKRESIAACERAGEEIREILDDDVRARMQSSLGGSSYEKTIPWLDDYAQAWTRARLVTCTATHVDHQRSAELDALSIECLDERRIALASQLESLMTGDAQTMAFAVEAASALPRIDPCVDDRWLARRPRPPNDADTSRKVIDARHALARAAVLSRSGQYHDALALARDTASLAEDLGWPPLIAAARHRVADLLEVVGRYPEAGVQAEQAYYAAELAGEDELAAESATLLVRIVGLRLRRHDEAIDRWVRAAETNLARSGRSDPRIEAQLLMYLAEAHREAGAPDKARPPAQRALAIIEEAFGVQHPLYANALLTAGRVEFLIGDSEAARRAFERALAVQKAALGDRHPGLATTLGNLALVANRMGEQAQARALYEDALAIREQALGSDHPLVATALHNLATVSHDMGDYVRARRLLDRALMIRERALGADHPEVADTLHMLAVVDAAIGDNESARRALERVLAIRRDALGDDHPLVADALNNLAAHYRDVGQPDEAMRLLEQSLPIRERALGGDHPAVAETLHNLGIVFAQLGQPERAQTMHERALQIWEASLGAQHPDLAYALLSLADTWLARGDPKRALTYAERAHRLRDQPTVRRRLWADTAFVLAQALAKSNDDPLRARELALQAREIFAQAEGTFPERDEVDTFIAGLR